MSSPRLLSLRKHTNLQQIARARNWFQGFMRGSCVMYTRIADSDFPGYPEFTPDEDMRLKAQEVVLAIERLSLSVEARWRLLRKQNKME